MGAVAANGTQIFVAYNDGDSGWADFPDDGTSALSPYTPKAVANHEPTVV